ncbi:hypothetical protein ACFV0L_07340 [Streptosporangium canum]|uniref:hypothetical protein n=1 Tax=Streptosporangium canum TaxID=324952 RepID=UPI0036C9846D
MALHITHTIMIDDLSGHCAQRSANGRWSVTGHPARTFTRDQAITALSIAEALALAPPPDHRLWLFINNWRAELDLPPLDPTDRSVRDAAPSAKTTAAPRNPATVKQHEVNPS